MNRKSTSSFQACTGKARAAMVLAASFATILQGQNAVTVSRPGSSDTSIAMHPIQTTFVASDAAIAQEAVKNAAISAAEGKVITAIAMKSLPIPVVGALPVDVAMKAFSKFRKSTVKGFDISFLQGLTSQASIQSGEANFTIPGQASQMFGQIGTPRLVRLRSSAKDSIRIVESAHVTFKMTGGSVNPTTKEILGTEQDVTVCAIETRGNGDVVVSPRTPLTPGDYAIIATLQQGGAMWAWDFRVLP